MSAIKDEPRMIDISLRLWGLVAAFERLTEHCAREAEKYPPGGYLQEIGYRQAGGAKAYAMAREALERELTAAGVPRDVEQMEGQATNEAGSVPVGHWVPWDDARGDKVPVCVDCALFGTFPNFPCLPCHVQSEVACAALSLDRKRSYFLPRKGGAA